MAKGFSLRTFLIIFALGGMAAPSAEASIFNKCNGLLVRHELTSHEQTSEHVAKLDRDKIEKSVEAISKRIGSSETPTIRERYNVVKSLLDALTARSVGRQNVAYQFRYIRDGSVLQVRMWVVKGLAPDAEILKGMLKRYQNFPADIHALIVRTAYVRAQAEKLEELSKTPRKDFPITFEAKMDDSSVVDPVTFYSPEEALKRLKSLKRTEPTIFDGGMIGKKFGQAFFLRSRRREQAHLERVLEIMVTELRKYPQAGHDADLREKFLTEAVDSLNDPNLKSNGASRLLESWRAFTEQIGFKFGHRDLSGAALGMAGQLNLGDRDGTGIDLERQGAVSRFMRGLGVKAPALAIGALAIIYTPTIKADFQIGKNYVYETLWPSWTTNQTLEETAQLPDEQFQMKAQELLKSRKQAIVVNGQVVLTPEGQKTMSQLREMRTNYLHVLKSSLERDSEFAAVLETGLSKDKITGDEFTALMQMPKATFMPTATKIASRQTTLAAKKDVFKRLVMAREGYEVDRENAALHPTDSSQSSKSEALFDAFAAFMISTAQEAGTQ